MDNKTYHQQRVEAAATAIDENYSRQYESDAQMMDWLALEALLAADSVPLPGEEEMVLEVAKSLSEALDNMRSADGICIEELAEAALATLRPYLRHPIDAHPCTSSPADVQNGGDLSDNIEIPSYESMTREELIECLHAADAHHQEHHAADKWQDISAAPKDKVYLGVIEYSHGMFGEPFIAHYEDGLHQCKYLTEALPHTPTHWMPLPAPPQNEKEGA